MEYSDKDELRKALELLKAMEFVTALPSKCPICLGFEMPQGETSKRHNKKCELAAFLKRHEGRF